MRIALLHKFMDNSIKDLLDTFKKHICYTPKLETLQTRDTDKVFKVNRPEDAPETPLFPIILLVNTENLLLDPSLTVTLNILHQLTDLWYENSTSMKSFIGDVIFRPFTKYVRKIFNIVKLFCLVLVQ